MDTTTNPVEPERLTFNRKTCETKVWATRVDDPAWDPDTDEPVDTYTATSIPRELFDTLPLKAQLLIVDARQAARVGWRQVDQRWESFDIDHHETYTRASGRAPHATRTQPRRRGAGRPAVRGASRRSSARSGDSGSEDGESEPPPRRLCACCGRDIPADRGPRAKYIDNTHAERDRQRRKRQRDRERDVRPPTPRPADFWRYYDLTADDLVDLRGLVECRCNGRHVEFDPGECFRCGHWLPRGVAA
jgi:hypothetical protein